MKKLLFVSASLLAVTVFAKTNYVDCVNGQDNKTDGRGSAESNAWYTLQYAVDNSAANDTIIVLPGVYDQGGGSQNSRVNVSNKKLRIESRDGRDRTFIIGQYNESVSNGWRCVRLNNTGGAVLKGFTLTGGCFTEGAGANMSGEAYVVDCVCSNNIATRGAGVMNGTAIGCWITENNCGGGAARGCNLYNCVLSRNAGGNAISYPKLVVNCTIIDNDTSNGSCIRYENDNGVYNSLFLFNNLKDSDTAKVWYNCVTCAKKANVCAAASENVLDEQSVYQVVSPAAGDWRPLAGSATATAGSADHLALIEMPDEFRYVDYYGYPIPQTGTIAAGAAQQTVTPAYGAIIMSDTNASIGERAHRLSGFYHYATEPGMIHIVPQKKDVPVFCYSPSVGQLRFPEKDDSLWLLPPPYGTDVTLTPQFASRVLYVDDDRHDDTGDGASPETAKHTIQAAVDAVEEGTSGGKGAVIYVAPGDYHEGGGNLFGTMSRVCVTNRAIRIVATGSAAETIIRGAPDQHAEEEKSGCGPDAYRCYAVFNLRNALQGFTLTDGHTALDSDASKRGAAFVTQSSQFPQVLDCIISNNVAGFAPGGFSGWMKRCRFENNRILKGGNDVVRYGVYSSCVFGRNLYETSVSGLIGTSNSKAYHCSVIGSAMNTNASVFRGSTSGFYNNIVAHFYCNAGSEPENMAGNVFYDYYDRYQVLSSGFLDADPGYLDWEHGDLRLDSSSAAIGLGQNDVADAWLWTTSGIDGAPVLFYNGRPTPGACQKPLLRVKLTGTRIYPAAGERVMEAGESFTLYYSGDEDFEGFSINGEKYVPDENFMTVAAEDRAYGPDDTLTIFALYKRPPLVLFVR